MRALQDGAQLDLSRGQDVDVSHATEWSAARRLPGEALRAALLKPDVRADPRGLTIRGAYITGLTDLADLRLAFGLHFESCDFEQPADWSRLMVASLRLTDCTMSGLTLDHAHINEVLDLQGVILTNKGGTALDLDSAEIKGGALLKRSAATGEVRAVGVTIGGQFDLRGTKLNNGGGVALALDGADIKGEVFLNPVRVTGEMRAIGATLGSNLNLQGARLHNVGGVALYLDGASIKGSAILERVTVVTGEVRALGVTIGSELNLKHATLHNDGGVALYLDAADIKGEVFLNAVTVTGDVQARSVAVGGPVDLEDAKLSSEGGNALYMESARLHHLWLTPAAVKGRIALDGAQITLLITPDDMKVFTSSELTAFGWRLGDVSGPIRHNRKAAADWLSHAKAEEFVPQSWHELANVYERNGQPADARWMRWKAAQGVTRTSPWWSKLIRMIYGVLVGHGYYPLIAAVWLILAIVASGIIVTANAGIFTPTATNKAAWKTPPPAGQPAPPITGATPCQDLQDRSSCLNPVLYAFDNALPGTLATGQAAQWTANGAQGWNTWIPYTLGGLKIASWILVALLLAGVTGLLRKT
jgi:hypothetical protein